MTLKIKVRELYVDGEPHYLVTGTDNKTLILAAALAEAADNEQVITARPDDITVGWMRFTPCLSEYDPCGEDHSGHYNPVAGPGRGVSRGAFVPVRPMTDEERDALYWTRQWGADCMPGQKIHPYPSEDAAREIAATWPAGRLYFRADGDQPWREVMDAVPAL